MKEFGFIVEVRDKYDVPVRRVIFETSKHLNGAVRKLYQEYDFEKVVRILD